MKSRLLGLGLIWLIGSLIVAIAVVAVLVYLALWASGMLLGMYGFERTVVFVLLLIWIWSWT